MDDLFLLDEKIGRKNERLGRFKKFKKLLVKKVGVTKRKELTK